MFAKIKATRELQLMINQYKKELDTCTDNIEKNELIVVIENLEWVVKELSDECGE